MVFITSYISGKRKIIIVKPVKLRSKFINNDIAKECWYKPSSEITLSDILSTVYENEGSCRDIALSHEGKPVGFNDRFEGDCNIVASIKLNGGKGGFGSMLRAIGAQIEKTTNREACRDLSGRRLRDINEEKRLKEYLSKKVEKEKKMLEQKRKKLEQLKEGPKHAFEDKTYFEQREKRERDIFDSLDKAFSSASGGSKNSCFNKKDDNGPKKKVTTSRMLGDLDESSDEESEPEENQPKFSQIENKQKKKTEDKQEIETKNSGMQEKGNGLKRAVETNDENSKRLKAS